MYRYKIFRPVTILLLQSPSTAIIHKNVSILQLNLLQHPTKLEEEGVKGTSLILSLFNVYVRRGMKSLSTEHPTYLRPNKFQSSQVQQL